MSGPRFCFEPLIVYDAQVEAAFLGETGRLSDARSHEVRAAYEAALRDLLRPVGVRDQQFNPLGKVEDKATNDWGPRADRALSSGVAVPLGMLDPIGWSEFCRLLARAGDGDIVRGRERVAAALAKQAEADVVAAMRDAPEAVRILVLSAVPADRVDMFAPSAREREASSALSRHLLVPEEASEPFWEFSDEDVDAASRMLTDFGRGNRLPSLVARYRSHYRLARAWRAMVEVAQARGGNIPDEAIPDDVWGDCVSAFVSGLESAGEDDLVTWAKAACAEHGGENTLRQVVQRLVLQKKSEADRFERPSP